MARECYVCKKTEASYKCPVCREPYCSAVCCKAHKADGCSKPPEAPQAAVAVGAQVSAPVKYDFPTEDTVPIEKLEKLKDSRELKECLKNPHVRNIMRAILTDPNPTKMIAYAMSEPIFVEMADACLKVIEPPDDGKPS